MTAPTASTSVLLVERDLGFLMWLGDLFMELGFQPVPALNCRQALRLARELNLELAAIVVNPELRGSRPMLAKLVEAAPHVRVILIRDSVDYALPAHGVLQRPSSSKPPFRPHWLSKIRTILTQKSIGHNA